MKRRRLIQSMLAAPVLWSSADWLAAQDGASQPRVAVVGAGVFGAWTALMLRRAGVEVTLIESRAAGHPRASSGGETRVIRHMYAEPLYVRMARRSLALWRQAEQDWGQELFHNTGVLFMAQPEGAGFFEAAGAALAAEGIKTETLDAGQLARRWPQIDIGGIARAVFEPDSGYLLARRACDALVGAFQRAGGRYVIADARPGDIRDGRLTALALSGGGQVQADRFVFACGPWLVRLFPEVLGPMLRITRQEVFYFGRPPGDRAHDETSMPVWADFGPTLWYGIPGSERRGFKIADDTHGAPIDPERADRIASRQGIENARAYLGRRFPALADAPLVDARVCQYSNTPDGHFIVDRHPEADNLWLVGGGSGHGFKHGPALGELVAQSVLSEAPVENRFRLERLAARS